MPQVLGDIRDTVTLDATFARSKPAVVFHLAAQSLVRCGYREPVETFDVNVTGTVKLLDAALRCDSVRAVVVVTSDKVYDSAAGVQPYDESSPLGGHEPYGASKACSEIVVAAYRDSFFRAKEIGVATARAGNVIGGGDWAADRIVPDAVRMLAAGAPVPLRYPNATRPWQHVLDPLHGYLLLAERLLNSPADAPETLNFGPHPSSCILVRDVVDSLTAHWGGHPGWVADPVTAPHEAPALTLSSDLAESRLGWKPLLELNHALEWTAEWYDKHRRGLAVWDATCAQIRRFETLAGWLH